ncbi:hypothetical protein [Coleofasciculus sp. H7-2]|uniref:hypothetical protein n=1 Tax=Coleofasciculus sp. H7-2 TaxID=3351545 RepID=UPI0036706058
MGANTRVKVREVKERGSRGAGASESSRGRRSAGEKDYSVLSPPFGKAKRLQSSVHPSGRRSAYSPQHSVHPSGRRSAYSPQSSVLSPQSSVLSPQSSVLSPQPSALIP